MEWLQEQWAFLLEWKEANKAIFNWIVFGSMATLVVSFIAVPIVIRRMPHDYFLEDSPKVEEIRERHSVLRIIFLILKNLVGGILFLGGVLMLIGPGQGLLTILIGLFLMDFPGKRNLEIRLMRTGPIKKTVDWIREKADKRPLILPDV